MQPLIRLTRLVFSTNSSSSPHLQLRTGSRERLERRALLAVTLLSYNLSNSTLASEDAVSRRCPHSQSATATSLRPRLIRLQGYSYQLLATTAAARRHSRRPLAHMAVHGQPLAVKYLSTCTQLHALYHSFPLPEAINHAISIIFSRHDEFRATFTRRDRKRSLICTIATSATFIVQVLADLDPGIGGVALLVQHVVTQWVYGSPLFAWFVFPCRTHDCSDERRRLNRLRRHVRLPRILRLVQQADRRICSMWRSFKTSIS